MLDKDMSDAVHARLAGEIDDLPPLPWDLLGHGLWGAVYDLGDGTVLKITQRHGGLGTGTSKLIREAAALKLLGGLALKRLRTPRLVAYGLWDNPFAFSGSYMGPPLAGWIRTERVAGRAHEETSFFGRMASEGQRFGEELGAAIALFQRETAPLLADAATLGNSLVRSLGEALPRIGSPEHRRKVELLKAACEAQGADAVLHGDINLTNVLSSRDGLAFIDFAEAGVGTAEADLRHFESKGTLRDAVFRGFAAVAGRMPDPERYRLGVAVDAAVSLAIGGDSGHPREGLRRRQWLDEMLRQSGIS